MLMQLAQIQLEVSHVLVMQAILVPENHARTSTNVVIHKFARHMQRVLIPLVVTHAYVTLDTVVMVSPVPI
jgi:hypothetical protein